MTRQRQYCAWFAIVATAILIAVVSVTALVLGMEKDRRHAEAETGRQDSIRLALWRLDGLLGPALAIEAQRPASDYTAFAGQEDAYTKMLRQIRPGEILLPSPLIAWQSEVFQLHFQVDASGTLTSPQAPSGNALDLASTNFQSLNLAANRSTLDAIGDRLDVQQLDRNIALGEERLDQAFRSGLTQQASAPSTVDVATQVRRTEGEWTRRQNLAFNNLRNDSNPIYGDNRNAMPNEGLVIDPSETEPPGPVIPFFTGDTPKEPGDLLLARRVVIAGTQYFQGVLCNWTRMRELLLQEIEDLLPGADLQPILATDDVTSSTSGMRLAALPVKLSPLPADPIATSSITVERLVLGGLWIAILGGLIAGAVSLRTTFLYGEKKSRFASAVTHELRTPLTTFQMYTELLADDMVPDANKRQTLLETLRSESLRLSGLVESVLAYARIEDGRAGARATAQPARPLIDRLIETLETRAATVGMTLRVSHDLSEHSNVVADPDGLSLILGNLVDNAGKYALSPGSTHAGGSPNTDESTNEELAGDRSRLATSANHDSSVIELDVLHRDRIVEIDVRDFGPGVPATERQAIFDAFERGERHKDDPTPGLGVGLSLARSLAREMGGDLTLVDDDQAGARFRLTLRAN